MPWDIRALDRMLLVLVIGAIAVGALAVRAPLWAWVEKALKVQNPPRTVAEKAADYTALTDALRSRLELSALIIGLLGGFLTIYLAYGTLRNQAMLTAKIAINADAGRLLDWERQNGNIRCLYNWYSSYDNGDACLAQIASSGDRYSEASLYIEEVLFIFKQAREDEDTWKSEYMNSINYWRGGVEEDPTGLFSNYLATVDENANLPPTMNKVKEAIKAAGLNMTNVCDGHYRVKACFEAFGGWVRAAAACSDVPISTQTATSLPNVRKLCRAAAETAKNSDIAHGAVEPN